MLVLASGSGCTLPWSGRPEPVNLVAPVALVARGSALAHPGAPERIAKAVEQATGRPVLLVEPPGGSGDHRRGLAAGLAKKNPDLAGYDWREPQCAAEASVLIALESNTDAVYQVALDTTSHERPVTPEDFESPDARGPALWKVVAAFGGGEPQTVREESIAGSVGISFFSGKPTPPPVRVERRATRLGPGGPANLIDPAVITAGALRDLPPPRAPEWESYARRLLTAGCPLLAMAVGEARLGTGSTFKSVRSAAVDVMRRRAKRRGAPAVARDAVVPGPAEETATSEAAPPSNEEPSCQALCSVHMIELCNNDMQLWIEHRVRWEATPCGTRRPDPFLEECYRHQWQSGTFDDACVKPCEATPEARARLQSILRRAGCPGYGGQEFSQLPRSTSP